MKYFLVFGCLLNGVALFSIVHADESKGLNPEPIPAHSVKKHQGAQSSSQRTQVPQHKQFSQTLLLPPPPQITPSLKGQETSKTKSPSHKESVQSRSASAQ